MKQEELKEYYNIYTDVWKLFMKFSSPDGTVAFWEKYTAVVEILDKKHNGSELFRKIVIATTAELERIEREIKHEP
jgi:hypothetical protein|nr:MAG TPA: hypothetical protein [Caudoviricetes sp.]